MKRVLLAGLLGAAGMFVWAFLAHTVLPLGTEGIKEIPDETALLTAMHDSMGNDSGLYIFPGIGLGKSSAEQREAMQHYQEKLNANPSGLLIYHPPGAKALSPGQLVTEFITEFLMAFLASLLLARAALNTYSQRVAFIVTIGIVAVLTTNVPYWNWYGFPGRYTANYMFTELIGFLITGLIVAKVLKKA